MRADNNWEDPVRKKLFEFEGPLTEQNWENISKQIQPKSKPWRRWLWLPALLVFIAIPVAFYFGAKNRESSETAEKTALQKPAERTQTNIPSPNTATIPATTKTSNSNVTEAGKQPVTPDQTGTVTSRKLPRRSEPGSALPAEPAKTTDLINGRKPKSITLAGSQIAAQEDSISERNKNAETKGRTATGNEILMATAQNKTTRKTVERTAVKVRETNIPEITKTGEISPQKPGYPEEISKVKNAANNAASQEPKQQTGATLNDKLTEEGKLAKNSGKTLPEAPILTREKAETLQADTLADKPASDQPVQPAPEAEAEKEKPEVALDPEPEQLKDTAKTTDPDQKKRWAYSVYAAPQYSYQRVIANVNDEVMILRMNNRNALEKERFGYEFGFRAFYQASTRIKLETGFHFARLNQHLNLTTLSNQADTLFSQQSNGQIQVSFRNREQDEIHLFRYYFGGLYAGADLELSSSWHLLGGLGSNWMFTKNPDEKTIPIATRNFTPYLSAGIRYQIPLSSKFTLQTGPTFQYYLRPVQQKTAIYGSKPVIFGFSVGLLFER